MNKIYGYCRISTPKQNIERQIRNILREYPDAIIIQEIFTGSRFQGRRELEKLIRNTQFGDTIIFDSVSRMSRNADEGFALYEQLYSKGVNLVFLRNLTSIQKLTAKFFRIRKFLSISTPETKLPINSCSLSFTLLMIT